VDNFILTLTKSMSCPPFIYPQNQKNSYVFSCFNQGYNTNRQCDSDKDCEQINICSKTESKAPTFGHTPQACSNSYVRFSNLYTCTKKSSNWTQICTEDSKIQSQFSDNGCCIYHPRVQITDNWGWCNGTCTGKGSDPNTPSPGGKGCYDKSWAKKTDRRDNECSYWFDREGINSSINNPHTPTSSIRVIVAPK